MRLGLAALCALLVLCAPAGAASPRVYNGTSQSSAPPWMGFLAVSVSDGTDFCTATAVSPNVVLTAAHCVVDQGRNAFVRPAQIGIAFGENDPWGALHAGTLRFAGVTEYRVPSTFRQFGAGGSANDVALLRLAAPAPGSVALLPPQRGDLLSVDRPAVVLGWGVVAGGGEPRALQRGDLRLQGYSRCSQTFSSYDSRTMLCAWSSQGQTACHGDSGGPLLVADASQRYYEIGVVAGGDATCNASYPNFFSNVATGALAGFVTRYAAQLQERADSGAPGSSQIVVPVSAPTALALATAVAAARSYAQRVWGLRVYSSTCTRRTTARLRCRVEGAKLGRRGWVGWMTVTRTSRGVIVSR